MLEPYARCCLPGDRQPDTSPLVHSRKTIISSLPDFLNRYGRDRKITGRALV